MNNQDGASHNNQHKLLVNNKDGDNQNKQHKYRMDSQNGDLVNKQDGVNQMNNLFNNHQEKVVVEGSQ